jgi:hypothetical protein
VTMQAGGSRQASNRAGRRCIQSRRQAKHQQAALVYSPGAALVEHVPRVY